MEAMLRGRVNESEVEALRALLRPLCGEPRELCTWHRSLRPTALQPATSALSGSELELVSELYADGRVRPASHLLRFVEGAPHAASLPAGGRVDAASAPGAISGGGASTVEEAETAAAVVFTPVRVACAGPGVEELLAVLPFEPRHAHARRSVQWTHGGAGSGGAQLRLVRRHTMATASAQTGDAGQPGGGIRTVALGPPTRAASWDVEAAATDARRGGESDVQRNERLRRQGPRADELGEAVDEALGRLEAQLRARGYDEVRRF
ncbi:hypothetical protein T492DRAFT_879128 [Pavlovales sp. CCMP2436]|nr:hypothetical protein T492DRAFT_879128 [Pavlovales sp. CCMP2436]